MIKIISGTYGLRKENRVIPKTTKSEPFETDPAEEKRLIDLGIAEKVDASVTTPVVTHEREAGENNSLGFENMSIKQLKEYVNQKDINIPRNAKKADIIAIIMSAESENSDEDILSVEEPGNDDMPDIKAQLPE